MEEQQTISIPEARAILRVWAREWSRPELEELSRKMVRRKPKYPMARAERSSLNPELAEQIRKFKDQNPNMANWKIGQVFGVDAGRVSEAIQKSKGM